MSTENALAAVAMAVILVLAGCAGPAGNGTDAPGAGTGDAATPAGGTAVEGSAGTVEFYVSDEENAIGDFAHLNVTITKIGLHRVDAGEESDDDDGDDDAESTETPERTTSDGTEANATATVTSSATTTHTATATPTPTSGEDEESNGEDEEREQEEDDEEDDETDEAENENDQEDDDGETEWVEYEVSRTVDLTELQGPNATKLEALAAPEGRYDKVFIYVDGIEATLQNGEEVNVKLPSNKLQIEKGFTVGNGQSVSFVFDLAVHRAGKSGKYILQPVIGQSGTSDEVEIDDVDERDDDGEEEEDEVEEDEGDEEENERDDDAHEDEAEATETEEPTETPEADDDGEDGDEDDGTDEGDGGGDNPSLWASISVVG